MIIIQGDQLKASYSIILASDELKPSKCIVLFHLILL